MRWRVIVCGTALLAVLALLYLSDRDEAQRDRKTRLMWRLWHRDAEQLALIAFHARKTGHRGKRAVAETPFPPWDEWPAKLRADARREGLKPVGTERIDNLIVTTFIKRTDVAARWFYVLPTSADLDQPWFRVIAICSEYCLYTEIPGDIDPVIEKRKKPIVDPIEVIKRLCSQPNDGRLDGPE